MVSIHSSFSGLVCNTTYDVFNTSTTTSAYPMYGSAAAVIYSPNGNTNTDPAIALGYTFSLGFFGIPVVQAFIYNTRFPGDSKWLKYLIWIILFMEGLSVVLTLYAFWEGETSACLSCSVSTAVSTPLVDFSCGSGSTAKIPAAIWTFF
ncbi:hypothetical protein SERLADRAFT_479364, partial [Serpula lacrymans var. lacrymans S7.9]